MDGDWTAVWIEPDEHHDGPAVQRPVHQLVGTFAVSGATSASLRITAHGIYEVFLNGRRVGDRELTPGFTAYRHRLQFQVHDVTHLVVEGENTIGVLLSDGWWRGQNTVGRRTNAYGDTVAVLAQLDLTAADGGVTTVGTDATWLSTPSHVVGADLMAGEIHDFRRRDPDWANPGHDRSTWTPVRVVDHGYDDLVPTVGPPVRRMEELPAVDVRQVGPRRHVVDFGQVSNGWIRLTDLGPEGTRLSIAHGEVLTPDGTDVQLKALAEAGVVTHDGWDFSFQTDVVVSAGNDDVFEPRHSTKGFRYVAIDGHPGPLTTTDLTSIVVRSDLSPRGSFTCSDDDLNWLHEATDWSLRTNCCDIPTDCPTRERAGWTGDWQIFVDVAAYLYDVTDFSAKWLADVVAEQLPSGAVLHFVPDPADHTADAVAWWTALQGSAGWGDAIVHVPWELYRATGSTDVLADTFDAMCRWVDFAADRAAEGRHPDRVAARPDPAPHEVFLWDSGFHFGEWNEPGFRPDAASHDDAAADDGAPDVPDMAARLAAMDHGPTATAFLHRSSSELAAIAGLLGHDDLATRYGELAGNVRDAWQREFLVDGRVEPASQANLVRALAFGLVPEADVDGVVDQLVALVHDVDDHLGTGFLATPMLLPVLADHGQLDVAYRVLRQRTPPSWLHMRDEGATTIWEGWTPFDDGIVRESLNHFSMGAVIGFLHRYVAGLRLLAPGWERFAVAPRPDVGVTHARAHHDSPHGRIQVAWSRDGDEAEIEVVVPPGTTAELSLPGQPSEDLASGTHQRTWKESA